MMQGSRISHAPTLPSTRSPLQNTRARTRPAGCARSRTDIRTTWRNRPRPAGEGEVEDLAGSALEVNLPQHLDRFRAIALHAVY